MSDSVLPQRQQPTRLHHPWDSPGKNAGVGCHFLLRSMKVKSESEVAQLCPTLCDPMDCSPPGSSIHRILQERVLEWGSIAFSLVNNKDEKFIGRRWVVWLIDERWNIYRKKCLSPVVLSKVRKVTFYTLGHLRCPIKLAFLRHTWENTACQ